MPPTAPAILAIYVAHRGELVNYANGIVGDRFSAEDVVQEAWVRLGAAADGKAIADPLSYLYRIVRNLAVDGRRRRTREDRTIAPDADQAMAPDARPSPEIEAADRDELRRVAEAWAELPERTRLAMELRQLAGWKLKDIAAHLGVSITVAHEIVADGIARLRLRVRPPV